MILQRTANKEFSDSGRGFFTDRLMHSAGSLSHWAAANSCRNLQFTIEPQTDGTFDVVKHLWISPAEYVSEDIDMAEYQPHSFEDDGITIMNCHSLKDAVTQTERMFNNERNTWESYSSNTQLLRGEEPDAEHMAWLHIENAADMPAPIAGQRLTAQKARLS